MTGTLLAIIGIDGPAGAGKSSVAKGLAKRMGYTYLDTGAMYRAVAWKIKQEGTEINDHEQLKKILNNIEINFKNNNIFVDNKDVTDFIRTSEITELTSKISTNEHVRNKLVQMQRKICLSGNFVVEGRDITTVVFPDTPFKFYLDASIETRAKRRHQELLNAGTILDFEQLKEAIRVRDKRDSERKLNPLKKAEDAFYINTDQYSIDEVVHIMVHQIERGKE